MVEPRLPVARILVVDDDHLALAVVAELVEACGFAAVTAASGAEALRAFRARPPDLALVDIVMPELDGFKLARMLKAESERFVPIILLTAHDDVDARRRGMAAGADDFLVKPVSQIELQIRLSSMLRIKLLTDQLEAANAKLAELAVTDALTGLSNRRALAVQLERELARARRYGHPLAALMLDVDHFKQINDEHGHPTGDRVLTLVGAVLRRSLRAEIDLAGRYGGEEFLVLAPETTREQAQVLAERLRCEVRAVSAATPGLPAVTVSIGFATTEGGDVSQGEELIRRADERLYQAKRAGRDRCVG